MSEAVIYLLASGCYCIQSSMLVVLYRDAEALLSVTVGVVKRIVRASEGAALAYDK